MPGSNLGSGSMCAILISFILFLKVVESMSSIRNDIAKDSCYLSCSISLVPTGGSEFGKCREF